MHDFPIQRKGDKQVWTRCFEPGWREFNLCTARDYERQKLNMANPQFQWASIIFFCPFFFRVLGSDSVFRALVCWEGQAKQHFDATQKKLEWGISGWIESESDLEFIQSGGDRRAAFTFFRLSCQLVQCIIESIKARFHSSTSLAGTKLLNRSRRHINPTSKNRINDDLPENPHCSLYLPPNNIQEEFVALHDVTSEAQGCAFNMQLLSPL